MRSVNYGVRSFATGRYETKSSRSFLTDLSQRFRHDNISIILGSGTKAFSIRLRIPRVIRCEPLRRDRQ